MDANKYSVTAKNGATYTRTTKRVYTHAIIGTWGESTNWNYSVWAWCGSYELARKQLVTLEKRSQSNAKSWGSTGAILEIVQVEKN